MKKLLLTFVALLAFTASVSAQNLPPYAFAKAEGGLFEFHVTRIECYGEHWLRPGVKGIENTPGACLAKWKNKIVLARSKSEAESKIRERFLKDKYHDTPLKICDRKDIRVKFEKPSWMDVIK